MKVRNVNGTSQNTCDCGSWLKHWETVVGRQAPKYCSELKCRQTAEVGAHVQKDDSDDQGWYIIPLCKTHNQAGGSIEIGNSVVLVSANVSNTCARM